MTTSSVHIPVLLHEIVRDLIPPQRSSNPIYVDGTLGGAGHAQAIAEALQGKLTIVGFDRDPQAITRAQTKLEKVSSKLILVQENYRNIDKVLAEHDIDNVDMILLDLGISSDELDESGRGFSFKRDEPLLMTLGDPATYAFTAKDIVNSWKEEDIANVIFGYGEERWARRIARGILEYRTKKSIETTHELVEIIRHSVPATYRFKKTHPATKTFQALRIATNDELESLKEGLEKGYAHLREGGRMAVISFHSLEDRIVKHFMRSREKEGARLISRRAVEPHPQEIAENPRSRSAKLRVIEKHTTPTII